MERILRQDAERRATARSQHHAPNIHGATSPQLYPHGPSDQVLRRVNGCDDSHTFTPHQRPHSSQPMNQLQYKSYSPYNSPISLQKSHEIFPSPEVSSTSTKYNDKSLHQPATRVYDETNRSEHDVALKARDEWQKYGKIKTQAIEGIRYGRHQPHIRHWKVGKVVSAEQRTDIAGSIYTAYILQIHDRSLSSDPHIANKPSTYLLENDHMPVASMQVIERRYSDFCKLHKLICGAFASETGKHQTSHIEQNGGTLNYDDWHDTITNRFPHKHWAGRVGNWTPAKYIAPQQYLDVIDERIQLFDAWLVYVLYAYNMYPIQRMQHQDSYFSEPQNSIVHDFFTNQSCPLPYMTKQQTSICSAATFQWNNPLTFTLSSAIRQATRTIVTMTQQIQRQQSNNTAMSTPSTIPIDLLQIATGIAFLTVAKLGMIVSGRIGTGLLLAKLPSMASADEQLVPQQYKKLPQPKAQWSAPVAIGTVGLGWGAVVGGDVTHYMIVFTTPDAVLDFGRNNTVHLGTELGLSVGSIGTAASKNIQAKSKDYFQYHSTYSYAVSSGLFFGVTLEGSVISVRDDVNAKFYGRPNIRVMDLLQSPGVPAAEGLYDALDIATQIEIPENAIFKISRYLESKDDGIGESNVNRLE